MENVTETTPDILLIKAYLKGKNQAFDILYYRYRKQLYGYLNNLLRGSSIDVDDIFEETWLKVIDKLPGYTDDGRFSAWLFRLAHNIFIDHIRKNRNRYFQSIDQEETPDLPTPDHHRPGEELSNQELAEAIAHAVGKLSAEQKEVFLLRQQELSFKEIANIQQCSLNTVLSRMHYAIKNLRIFLTETRKLIK